MKTYNVAKPYIDKEDIDEVVNVLKSGWLSLGPKHKEFEKALSKYLDVKHACSVSSGTAGLHLAVKALGLKEGDEVITSPFSFVASVNCLLYERIKPVLVDIEEKTFNIDSKKIEKAITNKTKAILVVHIFGQPANMGPILEIAKRNKLRIIEDACESIGSYYKNKMVGTIGDIGVFAFYPNKQMTTGEGGMVVTNNKRWNEICKSLRNQGRNKHGDWLNHERLGYNYRLDEMSASLGVTQLKKLDWMINQKRKIAGIYNNHLSRIKGVILPEVTEDGTHTWFVYAIRVNSNKRKKIIEGLSQKGIQAKPYFPAIHLQPYFKNIYKSVKGDFPIAEKLASETIALPFYIGLREKDIATITRELGKLLAEQSKE